MAVVIRVDEAHLSGGRIRVEATESLNDGAICFAKGLKRVGPCFEFPMVQVQIVIVDIMTAVNVLFHLTNRQSAKVTRLGGQCVNVIVAQRVNVFLNVGAKVFQAL